MWGLAPCVLEYRASLCPRARRPKAEKRFVLHCRSLCWGDPASPCIFHRLSSSFSLPFVVVFPAFPRPPTPLFTAFVEPHEAPRTGCRKPPAVVVAAVRAMVSTDTTTLAGLGRGAYNWMGGVLGKIYGIPYSAGSVLIIE